MRESFSNLSDSVGLEIVELNVNRSNVKAHNEATHKEVYWNSLILKRR